MLITLAGCDGSSWVLAGPGVDPDGAGVTLRPGPKRLIDAPAKTLWLQGAVNQSYQGVQFQRRDPTFIVNIIGDDPREWRDLDSAFRTALGMYDKQFTITVQTEDTTRSLDLRLLQDPTAWESGEWETGRDPHPFAASTLLVAAAAEQPFWYADDIVLTWEATTGTGSTTLPFQNFGDVIVWPRYFVNAPGSWVLPDYSWGQETEYQRAPGADSARTFPLTPLLAGEDSDVDSDPDEELIVAVNGAPVWARNDGDGLIYPIAPKTPVTPVPISVSGANPNAGVTVTIPQRFSRPIGVSL